VATKFYNSKRLCFVNGGQQDDGTADGQTLIHAAHSNLPLDEILPPPAEDMINDMWEESKDNAETQN
jgi:hypothetical protein